MTTPPAPQNPHFNRPPGTGPAGGPAPGGQPAAPAVPPAYQATQAAHRPPAAPAAGPAQPGHPAAPHPQSDQPSNPRFSSPSNPRFAAQPSGAGHAAPPSAAPGDFTRPVELACVLDPDSVMKRMIPMLIFTFVFAGLVVAVIFGIASGGAGGPVATYGVGALAGAAVSTLIYLRTKARLTDTYGSKQRLRLSQAGLSKVDGDVQIDMPWSAISHLLNHNSALQTRGVGIGAGAAGVVANAAIASSQLKMNIAIVGRGRLTPLPGAGAARLKAHDQSSGGVSRLRRGEPYDSPQAAIFPSEFEENWQQGVIGAWLRHYRPDVQLRAS